MSAALRLPAFLSHREGIVSVIYGGRRSRHIRKEKIVGTAGNIRRQICEKFGTVYDILEQSGGHVAHSYVTNNCWDGKDAIVTARVKSLTDCHCDFVRTDLETGEPRGVWYLDVYTKECRCVASGYEYWHVGVSPRGNLLAADTQIDGSHSEVILIDQKRGEEIPLVFAKTNWTHPCHPHPVFNSDGTRVCFETLNEKGNLCVGIVNLAQKYSQGGGDGK